MNITAARYSQERLSMRKNAMKEMQRRTREIDFLRCVLILLMITFHIVYIGDTYDVAKRVVYTFHMPVFLMVSGYLCNTSKDGRVFFRSMKWIFIPYLVMETGYVLMASVLPIREHIDTLTPALMLDKLFLHPLGPYWYLHTWVLCSVIYFLAMRLTRLRPALRLVFAVAGCLLFAAAGLMSVPNVLYFMAGAVLRQTGVSFLAAFRPAWWSILPVVPIVVFMPSQLDRATPGGIAMVYLTTSFILYIYRFTRGSVRRSLLFVGSNTLLLLLFSPVFTALSKLYLSLFISFDPSGILFCMVTVTMAVVGSFLLGYASDRLHISPLFFGKEKVFR